VGTGRNISSTSSTPKKTVQSVSSRSHYQNLPPISRLGEVDEYKKTEAMIGFAPEKKRKAVLSELERRSSFRGEIESGPHQRRTSLMSEPPVSVSKGAPPTNVHGVGKNPILVEDLELEEMVELSQVPKAPQGRMRNATSRPAANKFPATTERSQYFGNTDKHGATKNGVPNTGVSSDSSGSTVGASEREEGGSPGSSQSLGNAVDEVQYPEEDSIDLVESADGPERVDQKAEGRGRAKYNVMKPFASPKSKSISEEGDIPQSAFSGVRSKNKQSQTSRMLKSELTFEITYMQSGHKDFNVNDDCVPWRLQYDHDKKEFDIIAYGDSVRDKYPSLVLKPEKIHIVKYHQHGLTVVISRAMEPSTGSAAQVLVKMRRPGDGDRLAQSLKKLNHTIKLSPLGRSVSYSPRAYHPTDSLRPLQ
jgi:hypothetical protein